MVNPIASTSAHLSTSERSCQVRVREGACLADPVVEVAMFVPGPAGMTQRTVRACRHHELVLRGRYPEQIVAIRAWSPEPREAIAEARAEEAARVKAALGL